ncbi:MAG: hypothetical protein H6600_01560 [Flavobacteriales bacterium]|nr:hypothetical protein [Flavobacteriales bacterium]
MKLFLPLLLWFICDQGLTQSILITYDTTDFRPVNLIEIVKIDHQTKMQEIMNFDTNFVMVYYKKSQFVDTVHCFACFPSPGPKGLVETKFLTSETYFNSDSLLYLSYAVPIEELDYTKDGKLIKRIIYEPLAYQTSTVTGPVDLYGAGPHPVSERLNFLYKQIEYFDLSGHICKRENYHKGVLVKVQSEGCP